MLVISSSNNTVELFGKLYVLTLTRTQEKNFVSEFMIKRFNNPQGVNLIESIIVDKSSFLSQHPSTASNKDWGIFIENIELSILETSSTAIFGRLES